MRECPNAKIMSHHPVNLALRFFLELAAIAAMAYGSWTASEGILRVLLAVGVPMVAAAAWGTFRVPDDPGKPPVQVPGWVRLLLEVVFFGTAVVLLSAEQSTMALLFGVVVALHYLVSYDRIIWLLTKR